MFNVMWQMGQMAKQRFSKNKLVSALRQSHGIKQHTALILNCDRRTIDRYLEKYPDIKETVKAIKEQTKDECEYILLTEFINKPLVSPKQRLDAVKFFLKTQARDRGYIEQSNFDFSTGGDKISEIKISVLDAQHPNSNEFAVSEISETKDLSNSNE